MTNNEHNKQFFVLVVDEAMYDGMTALMNAAAKGDAFTLMIPGDLATGKKIASGLLEYARIMNEEGHKRGWCKSTACTHVKET